MDLIFSRDLFVYCKQKQGPFKGFIKTFMHNLYLILYSHFNLTINALKIN